MIKKQGKGNDKEIGKGNRKGNREREMIRE